MCLNRRKVEPPGTGIELFRGLASAFWIYVVAGLFLWALFGDWLT